MGLGFRVEGLGFRVMGLGLLQAPLCATEDPSNFSWMLVTVK